MRIQLSDHFNYRRLLRFTLAPITMMIFSSVYGVVDGFFVSNFVGKDAFTAVNLIMPFLMITATVGFMFGTGGSAIVAKTMGEGDNERARRYFSLFVYVSAVLGVLLSALGFIYMPQVAQLLGAKGIILEHCVAYGRIMMISLPFYILQMEFQSFFVTAEKPQLGLCIIVISGVTNMLLDYIFIVLLEWGLEGAAFATAISEFIGGTVPVCYFLAKNNSLLRLGRTHFYGRAIVKACTNGSSEFMSNVSMSLVAMLYNVQLLHYAGEDGVAAYGVLMYVSLIFAGAFIGYSIGSAPVISYHYGAQNYDELKNLLRRSLRIVTCFSLGMFALSQLLTVPLSLLFVGYDADLYNMTCHGFRIFGFGFLFMGFAIFGSGFFTALNNGLTSALISFLRTMVFQMASVLLLPLLWDLDGIWLSIVAAEFMAMLLSAGFMLAKRKKYHY